MATKDDLKRYIHTKLHSLLEDMVTSILLEQPKTPEQFMLDWLISRSNTQLSDNERSELTTLRSEYKSLTEQNKDSSASNSETEESDEESEEEIPVAPQKKMKARASVSAEAFGMWNKKSAFKPRFIPKSDEQKERISERLSKAFMFAALDDSEREILVNSMEERRFQAGDQVITQGDDGNELFVVDSGKLECSKVFVQGEPSKFLKFYEPGDSFGELALLYNVPRAASIKTVTDCVCFVLDRDCFNHIVKDAAARKRERYENFLASVELLENMDPYERSQISDALKPAVFIEGDKVITEGDWGEEFYMIEEGNAIATKTFNPGETPKEVKMYKPGDYFGELCLLRGQPRAANIIATSKLSCVTLDRKAFKRMLGPLDDILRRNARKYEGILGI